MCESASAIFNPETGASTVMLIDFVAAKRLIITIIGMRSNRHISFFAIEYSPFGEKLHRLDCSLLQ